MVKRFGWLFGVRIAISGAVFTAMGFVAKAMFSSMSRMANEGVNSLGSMFSATENAGMTFYDTAGNMIDPSSLGIDVSQLGVSGGSPFGLSNFTMSAAVPESFTILCILSFG